MHVVCSRKPQGFKYSSMYSRLKFVFLNDVYPGCCIMQWTRGVKDSTRRQVPVDKYCCCGEMDAAEVRK
jgi:hypothetical protein